LASATTVIADMTATTFCDSSGVRLLVMAHEEAAATGVDLRLVVPSVNVLRTLALIGADWLLPIYPSLEDALGPEPRAGSVSYLPSPGPAAASEDGPPVAALPHPTVPWPLCRMDGPHDG
jgi:hypothetical protein